MLQTSALAAAWILATATSPAPAETTPLKPGLAPIAFLLGAWTSDDGKVADTGGTSRGSSTIEAEAAGSVLLRRDHTDLFAADGKPSGSFDQIMLIYAEDGALHADYSDGDHVIHYTTAEVVPGRSVAFTSAAVPNAPTFRLTYTLQNPTTLTLTFDIEPPGQTAFRLIAGGTLHKITGVSSVTLGAADFTLRKNILG